MKRPESAEFDARVLMLCEFPRAPMKYLGIAVICILVPRIQHLIIVPGAVNKVTKALLLGSSRGFRPIVINRAGNQIVVAILVVYHRVHFLPVGPALVGLHIACVLLLRHLMGIRVN